MLFSTYYLQHATSCSDMVFSISGRALPKANCPNPGTGVNPWYNRSEKWCVNRTHACSAKAMEWAIRSSKWTWTCEHVNARMKRWPLTHKVMTAYWRCERVQTKVLRSCKGAQYECEHAQSVHAPRGEHARPMQRVAHMMQGGWIHVTLACYLSRWRDEIRETVDCRSVHEHSFVPLLCRWTLHTTSCICYMLDVGQQKHIAHNNKQNLPLM